MTDHWPDGTPIRRGPDPEGPWGAEPIERWVRAIGAALRAELPADWTVVVQDL